MRIRVSRRFAALVAAVALGGGLVGTGWAMLGEPAAGQPTVAPAPRPSRPVCDRTVPPGFAACLALVRTDVPVRAAEVAPNATPAGYGPADLRDAYDLPSDSGGAGQTVAIVDAFDNPNVEADLGVYREQYGLPPCTTANGCFRKVNQRGVQGDYPPADAGWAGEIALDVDMVSAACPNCHILLVEADDNSFDNLTAAVNQAVALGAKYVSNSYGGAEDPAETTYDAFYDHPGVVVTASSGDDGFGVSFPASSPHVTAVGGTSLFRDSSARGWAETVWSGAGSGCAAFEDKPSWQSDTGCANRSVADVSAVADPATGVAVYLTYQSGGWGVFGGTSASAPIIASVYALAGTPVAETNPAQYPYDASGSLYDVTEGSNGSCTPAYLCTAGPGFDGPTGLGTPHGVSAFRSVPRGVLTGKVTDSVTGEPVPGSQVDIGTLTATAGADGTYQMKPETGTYQMAVSAFGYRTATVADVHVENGQTTVRDVALTSVPSATLSGTVTDGSGHGWPLYARISVPGTPVATYTDPVTGAYQLTLGTGVDHQVNVDPVYPGYQRATVQVHLDGDATRDVAVSVEADACAAPGYRFVHDGPGQSFDGTGTPAGWTVHSESPHGWQFDRPGGLPNNTGGAGNFAVADAEHYGSWMDSTLTSSAFDLSADAAPVVEWKQDPRMWPGTSATVDVSVDGGSWQQIYRLDGSINRYGPETEVVAIPEAAGHTAVRVRFHFVTDYASFWWSVDDVHVGSRTCATVDGGMIVGTVSDWRTGAGVNRAVVTSAADPTRRAVAVATPDDPRTGDGFYHLFTAETGPQQVVATRPGYRQARATVSVAPDSVVRQDFVLRTR